MPLRCQSVLTISKPVSCHDSLLLRGGFSGKMKLPQLPVTASQGCVCLVSFLRDRVSPSCLVHCSLLPLTACMPSHFSGKLARPWLASIVFLAGFCILHCIFSLCFLQGESSCFFQNSWLGQFLGNFSRWIWTLLVPMAPFLLLFILLYIFSPCLLNLLSSVS